ncbi:N-acetylglucosamine kinase [Stygiobacter electus]|uniref:BadF/BadG/BcrA/BcrD ATPase family protein n=1 Tax=Stygiobacter electus TaxID=3032292 RepID=A0AAE3P332_9BACT|nr:BadF/BadG/BcrA/BcrD ATPase family protein [Stygiobacter electus]MDF1612203.1 BadF/BadG/BcrA/BcrD ATPase family protein [Stygiobacter electus]
MKKYLIGLDGGGTKTKCVVTDFQFNKLYECVGGASNFLIIGTEKVSETIFSLIKESVDNLKINYDEISAVLIGTTGAGRIEDANKLKNDFTEFTKSKGIELKFFVESDARIALEGAFSGKPGSLLIAGTGSIIFGKDKSGNIYRVGGFGKLIGDEGSGLVIGRKGLQAVSKFFDGRIDKTLLADFLKNEFNISDGASLISAIYRNNFDIASFAPNVIQAAQQNDFEALKICEDETDELILHVKAMYNLLNERIMKLSLVGGIISTDNFYSNLFKKKLNEQLPFVEIVNPENPPEIGAVILAKEKIN